MPRGRLLAWVARGAQETEWAERHEESTSCREASKDRAGLGGTWMLGWASRTPVFRLGAEVGGVVVALSPQALPAHISRQESRARWHGQADKATGCSQRRGAVGPGGAPAFLLPGHLCPHLSSKARERTGSRSINAKTGGPQLLTLGLIKSISPSILIQLLSTAIRWVIE